MKNRRKKQKINLKKVLFVIAIVIIAIILIKSTNSKKDENVKVSKDHQQDLTAPEIYLDEKNIFVIGEEFEDNTKATDDVDGDITSKITKTGEVDVNKAGTYEITYSVTDNAGNTTEKKREVSVCEALKNGLPVLMYHFFYDQNIKTSGIDNNYIEISKFEEQMKYLSENNFYFPTWEEVEDYIDGKIYLPEKSVVITVDDGDDSFFELAIPVIQKYNVQATSFVITSWYGWRANDKQSNISYQSHSDAMHVGGANGKGVMLSWSYDQMFEDLKTSSNTLGGATIFCYPFGHYNDLDKQVLKDAGYKLAFTVNAGRVFKNSPKYELPRVRISGNTTLTEFKNLVN